MGTDLVIAAPTFLDLTFVGLDALPAPGEERFAGSMERSPGGGGISAVAGARLGLSVAVAAPLGSDAAGDFLRGVFEREGIAVIPRRSRHTPTTVVMPVGGEGAMVTVDEGVRAYKAEVTAFEPRAVITTLHVLHTVPDGAAAYVVCGDDDARAFAGRPPGELSGVRAIFVNAREAVALTGQSTVEDAADRLAQLAQTVVVTRGQEGVLALVSGARVRFPWLDHQAAMERTGARDLLAAAHCWADLNGAEPVDCVCWSAVYASLSLGAPTAADGASDEARLLDEGVRAGLAPPRSRA